MADRRPTKLLEAASAALPGPKLRLLEQLHRFTGGRLEAAENAAGRLMDALESARTRAAQAELHAFLRESWEALDGLGREINLCMQHRFPEAGLYPPFEMTRQCTFYMVRKKLHEHPDISDHPLSRLLWRETREEPAPAYRRLSFLYNLSLFLPVPLAQGRALPGTDDLPPAARAIIKAQRIEPCPADEGPAEILSWLRRFSEESYRLLQGLLASC